MIYDDQSVPAIAVQLFEKMATVDKVDFFVGPDWSSIGGPVPPDRRRYKIPMVMANVATPSLYERGLKYFRGTPFPVVPRWSDALLRHDVEDQPEAADASSSSPTTTR